MSMSEAGACPVRATADQTDLLTRDPSSPVRNLEHSERLHNTTRPRSHRGSSLQTAKCYTTRRLPDGES